MPIMKKNAGHHDRPTGGLLNSTGNVGEYRVGATADQTYGTDDDDQNHCQHYRVLRNVLAFLFPPEPEKKTHSWTLTTCRGMERPFYATDLHQLIADAKHHPARTILPLNAILMVSKLRLQRGQQTKLAGSVPLSRTRIITFQTDGCAVISKAPGMLPGGHGHPSCCRILRPVEIYPRRAA